MSTTQEEEFYGRLKEELATTSLWPAEYLYKFIIPSDNQKFATIEAIFDGKDPEIASKQSSNGKYTSISIKLKLENPDEVIYFYKEVGKIEGVISL